MFYFFLFFQFSFDWKAPCYIGNCLLSMKKCYCMTMMMNFKLSPECLSAVSSVPFFCLYSAYVASVNACQPNCERLSVRICMSNSIQWLHRWYLLNIEPFGQLAILFKTGRGPKGWGGEVCRSYTEAWERTWMLVKSWSCFLKNSCTLSHGRSTCFLVNVL